MDANPEWWKALPIQEVIPHRGTMSLLTRIIAYSDDTISTTAEIRADNPFYIEQKGVPVCIGFEYMAQTMAAFAGLAALRDRVPVKLGVLVGCRRALCVRPFFNEGQKLRINATLDWESDGMGNFDARIFDDDTDEELMSGRVNVYQPEDTIAFFNLARAD